MFPSASARTHDNTFTIDVLADPTCTPRPVILQHHGIRFDGDAIQLLPCAAEWGKLDTSPAVEHIIARIRKDDTVTLSYIEAMRVYLQGWKWAEEVHDRTLQAMLQHLPDQPYPHQDPHSQTVLLAHCLRHPTSSLAKDFKSRVGSNVSKEWLKKVLYIAHMNNRHKSLATTLGQTQRTKETRGQKDSTNERRGGD